MPRILYIDDNQTDMQIAATAFEASGQFEIDWSTSYDDLKNHLMHGKYALAVSEVAPFGTQPFHILNFILSQKPEIPVIILAKDGGIPLVVSTIKLGAVDFLVKSPETFLQLPAKLAAVLAEPQDVSKDTRAMSHPGAESFLQLSENSQEISFRYDFSPTPHFSRVKSLTESGAESNPGPGILSKDSSLIWLEIRTKPVADPAGKVVAVDGIVRNITPAKVSEAQLSLYSDEIIRKNQELAEARDKAIEASQLKSDFLAMMSHDIRTPINAITGMTELILETPLTKDQREYAEVVKDSTRILLDLINDILDFSKIEAGKLGLEIIEFDPLEVIEGVAEMFATQARRKAIDLNLFISPTIQSRLRGDPVRLRQVLMNLVSNAIKFTEKGEVNIRVDPVDETDQFSMLLFQVRDSGIGIPESAMSQIFQPFVQASGSTARRYGGTGLGLAISKQLVELMDGEISLDSREGEGSTFWFTAFFHKSPLPAIKETRSDHYAGLSVLVMAPNATLCNNLQTYLALNNIPNESAPDFDSVLALLKSKPGLRFSACILDLDLSQPEAIQTIQLIRQMPQFLGASLVLLIPFDQRSQAEKALQAGFASYLLKPVKRTEFFKTLAKINKVGTVALPEPSSISNQRTSSPPVEAVKDPSAAFRVLLAEDNPTSQRLASIQLLKLGYQADVVSNGAQALQKVAAQPGHYHLVLMDCQMPELDGYEATRMIRQAEKSSGTYVPIIAMTANAIKGDREICLASGMDDYISKPVSFDTLRQITQKWVNLLGPALQTSGRQTSESTGPLNPAVIQEIYSMQEAGKPDFFTELIDIYLRDSWVILGKIQRASDEDDAYLFKRGVHSLKGSSSNLGATDLANLCAEAELILENKDLPAAKLKMNQIEAEYQRVRQALIARRKPTP